jgi:hypothetical protein
MALFKKESFIELSPETKQIRLLYHCEIHKFHNEEHRLIFF